MGVQGQLKHNASVHGELKHDAGIMQWLLDETGPDTHHRRKGQSEERGTQFFFLFPSVPSAKKHLRLPKEHLVTCSLAEGHLGTCCNHSQAKHHLAT